MNPGKVSLTMIVYRTHDNDEPLAWVRGVPIYVTTLLVAIYSLLKLGMLLAGQGAEASLNGFLAFESAAVWSGEVWKAFTYPLANGGTNLLFFAIEMIFFYVFGREVEKYLGRKEFLKLYGTLYLVPPILLTGMGYFFPMQMMGSGVIHFCVFLGFAKLYPGVEFFFRIPLAWVAGVLLAVYLVIDYVNEDWGRLLAIAASAVAVWYFLEVWSGSLLTPREWWRYHRWRKAAAPVGEKLEDDYSTEGRSPMETIDPILDKIASHGLASLTEEEREILEQVRAELLRKENSEH